MNVLANTQPGLFLPGNCVQLWVHGNSRASPESALGLEQLINWMRLGSGRTIPAPSAPGHAAVPRTALLPCPALGTSFPKQLQGFHQQLGYKGCQGHRQPCHTAGLPGDSHEGHPGAPGTGSSVPGMWVTPWAPRGSPAAGWEGENGIFWLKSCYLAPQ